MADITSTLLQQTGFGFMAGVFLWLYVTERKEHATTRKEKDALMEARRLDAKETLEKVEEPLSSIAQSTKFIADKLIAVRKGK